MTQNAERAAVGAATSGSSVASITPEALVLKRLYTARRAKLWQAWTEPARLKRWFSSEHCALDEVELDLRIGGAYRFCFLCKNKETGRLEDETVVSGVYEVVRQPEQLVFTWAVSGACENVSDTRVSVEFVERADGTEVRLTHTGLATEQDRENHRKGWIECLEQIGVEVDG